MNGAHLQGRLVNTVTRQHQTQESVLPLIVMTEGHPRGNGDGPLTRITFSRNGRG